MINRLLCLTACSVLIVACGGGKYDRSEIPATTGNPQTVESPSTSTNTYGSASAVPAATVASSNSKPVIYDYPGSVRQIGLAPGTASAATATATKPSSVGTISTAASAAGEKNYVVQSGDSLWRIANNHGVTVTALKQANGLANDTIKPGQVLHIP